MAKYFKDAEFRRCDPPCHEKDMDKSFMAKLDLIREKAGIPLVMTSAYRSPSYEKSKGRSGKGDHPQGKGVDIVANTSATRMKIVSAALAEGITRIGIGKTYVHIGMGEDLPTNVMWDYYK